MIRLIATDLDDTLLDASSGMTPRTQRALNAAMALGCGVTLSSGRMMEAMLPFAQRIGVNAPMPSLGSLASEALNGVSSYSYRLVIPALVISLIVLGLNLFGDGLRDAFDPKLNQ